MTVTRRKLIEVALPLDAINAASRREKSIRHGHPSTLHLWWARRPLAAARAVIFAQMVDDPSANPEQFPTKEAQDRERDRLFGILEQLVRWENTTNEALLAEARRGDPSELAAGLQGQRQTIPRARELFESGSAARVPRSLRWWWDATAGGAEIGAGSPRQRPEPRGGPDQQGDDRDPAEVCGQFAG